MHTMQDTPIYLLFHFALASQIWRLNSKLYFDFYLFCVCSLFFSALDSVPTWMTTTRTSWKGRTFWWLIMMLTMRKTLKAPTIGGTGRCLGGGGAHLMFVAFFCFWSCSFPADFKSVQRWLILRSILNILSFVFCLVQDHAPPLWQLATC